MAKGIYREAANARRLGKSAIRSLSKALKLSRSRTSKKLIRQQIRTLKTNVARSYRGTGYSIEEAIGKINSIVQPQKGMGARQRAQQATISRITSEQNGLGGNIAKTKKTEKIFWKRTMAMWKGGPKEERLQRTMDWLNSHGWDVHDLGEAFDVVMKDNNSVQAALRHYEENGSWYQADDYNSDPELGYVDVIHTAADITSNIYRRKKR